MTKDSAYATYQPAYRTEYEGRRQYPGKKYEEGEPAGFIASVFGAIILLILYRMIFGRRKNST